MAGPSRKIPAMSEIEQRLREAEAIEQACKAHAPQWDGIDPAIKVYAREQMRSAVSAYLNADYFGSLVEKARQAAAKASVKFPQPNYVTLKIAEEAGEVVRGAVHYAEKRMEWDEVEGEIVQLLAMLIRFVTEGDQINGVTPPAEPVVEAPQPANSVRKAAERVVWFDWSSNDPDAVAAVDALRAALAAKPAVKDDETVVEAPQAIRDQEIQWAVERWRAEVENRPLVNVHRRSLDGTWRQMIRHFGGDPEALCGPSHDDLLAAKDGRHE